jgi:mannosyltransferase OCH1-like enzyme
MIPKIIHYCWLSEDQIPEKLRQCMSSWKEKLHGYEFMLWNFDRFDISVSIWVKQAFEVKKYAFAADFIRLYAVYRYGGIYLDTDIEVIKSFDDLLDSNIMLGYEDNHTKDVEAGCIGAEKGSILIKKCLDYYNDRKFIKPNGDYDMIPLPQIMRNIFNKIDTNISFHSADYFTAKNFRTGRITVTNNTYTIHHFAGSWLSERDVLSIKYQRKIRAVLGDNALSKCIIYIIYAAKSTTTKIRDEGLFAAVRYYYYKIIPPPNQQTKNHIQTNNPPNNTHRNPP